MRQIFDYDSPLMQFLSKLADLVLLNVMFLISSIPIFTIGAANVAMYTVVGKFIRKEGRLFHTYLDAFRKNFCQATILWLIFAAVGALTLFAVIFYIQLDSVLRMPVLALLFLLVFLLLSAASWSFPLLSRFDNSVKHTLRNACYCAILYLPRTVLMVALNIVPTIVFLSATGIFLNLVPLWLMLWSAMNAYAIMRLLNKPFAILESLGTHSDHTSTEA